MNSRRHVGTAPRDYPSPFEKDPRTGGIEVFLTKMEVPNETFVDLCGHLLTPLQARSLAALLIVGAETLEKHEDRRLR